MPPNITVDDGTGSHNEAKVAEPAHIASLLRYLAVAFIALSFLGFSNVLPRDSAAFGWTNRIGLLVLLTLTVGYAINDLWATLTGKRSGLSWVDRWALVLVSVIIPAVLLLKLWARVLDALWLK